jgi:hypothetical protein
LALTAGAVLEAAIAGADRPKLKAAKLAARKNPINGLFIR